MSYNFCHFILDYDSHVPWWICTLCTSGIGISVDDTVAFVLERVNITRRGKSYVLLFIIFS